MASLSPTLTALAFGVTMLPVGGVLHYAGKKSGAFAKLGQWNQARAATKAANALKPSGASNVAKFSQVASKGANIGTNIAKNVAKVNPAGLALGAASIAGRELVGVEDDGGLGDSALDVVEMAGYGSGIGMTLGAAAGLIGGPFAPLTVPAGAALGATVGGVLGFGAGIGNELWEWATDDDGEQAIPSSNIGNMQSQTTQKTDKGEKTVNVEVNNSIAKDLIVTNVNADGDLSTDVQSTNNLKGR